MRIDKLKLTRFGSFTNKAINFDLASDGLDLHVVFGPNEAGKSTLRAAVENLLFGIPRRTDYGFLHESKTLQIEATLSSDDVTHELIRIKRDTQSLLSTDLQPVGDDLLRPMLSGVDRDAYVNIFSMDEDSLEQGGNSILESKGDLSELLFSSTSGLSALGGALSDIRQEVETFHKTRAQRTVLKQKSAEHKALKDEIRSLDMAASQFAALKKTQSQARDAYEAASIDRKENAAKVSRLKALVDSVQPWRDYLACEEKLLALPELPEVPPGWTQRAQALATNAAKLDTRIEALQTRVHATEGEIDATEVKQEWLTAAPQIDRLGADDLEAKFRAADSLSETQAALDSLNEQIKSVLTKLSPPSGHTAQDLPLPVARVGQIKVLMEQRSALDASLEIAANEQVRALEALETAHASRIDLDAEGETAADLSELERKVAVIKESALVQKLTLALDAHRAQEAQARQSFRQLEPWRGDSNELAALNPPTTAQLSELSEHHRTLTEQQVLLGQELDRLTTERSQAKAAELALRARSELVDDAAAVASRQQRDQRWQEHLMALDKPAPESPLIDTAERFAAALAEDDALHAVRFAQASEIAERRGYELQVARTSAALEQNRAKSRSLDDEQHSLASTVEDLCGQLGLPYVSTAANLAELGPWLERRREALRESDKLQALSAAVDDSCKELTEAVKSINEGLGEAGLKAPHKESSTGSAEQTANDLAIKLKDSLDRAEFAIDRWHRRERRVDEVSRAVQQAQTELESRQARLEAKKSELNVWTTAWREALSGLWVAADNRTPGTTEIAEVLRALDELSGLLAKLRDGEIALVAMQGNRSRYLEEVASVATTLGLEVQTDDPLQTADRLRAELATVRDSARRKAEAQEQLCTLNEQLSTELEHQAQAKAEFREMAALFPSESFAELLGSLQQSSERSQIQQTRAALQRQLLNTSGAASLEEMRALLEPSLLSPETLEQLNADYAEATATDEEFTAQTQQLYHEWQAAKLRLAAIGDDEQVAILNEKARVMLLDIEADAQRYIALSAGTRVVDRALRTYLDTHRSTMLTRASAAFATITRGAFTGLDAMPGIAGKSKEELVGIRRYGPSISAQNMSRGSRFQLYLSLRIAGYHEFAAERDPLPFFADDILETFDDDRSAETFGLMAEMAERGQVIYLTHHRHLCEIAQQVTGGRAQIHELPARSIQASPDV